MLDRRGGRAGFSLAELIVAFTLLGILGATFTRIMVTQGRFTDQQNALRGARTVARGRVMQILNLKKSTERAEAKGAIDPRRQSR